MLYSTKANNKAIKVALQSVTVMRVWHAESLCPSLPSRTWPLALLGYCLDPEECGVKRKVE